MSLSSKINYAFEALSGITVGNINITGNIFQNNNPYIASQWTSTSGNALTYTSGNVIISNGSLVASNLTTGNINFTGTLSQNGSPYIGSQWTGTSGTLYYGTAGSSVVGINTTAPVYTLDVNGTLEASNANGLFLFASTGNVGIGTTSPTTKLDVTGTGRITTSLTTGALYSTNQTTTNIVGTTATITNLNIPGTLTVVNITSTNLVDSNITATNLRVTGTTSVANIYSSLGTISNVVNTNLSTSTLSVSSNMVTPRVDIGGTQSTYNNNTLGKLFITGGQNSVTGGPNILITTTQDNFPTYNFLTYGHDSSWTMYDMYFDGSFRNSGTATAFMMVKESSTLKWNYNTSGFSAGATAPVSTSICIGSSGNVGLGGQVTPAYTLDVTGTARISSGLTAGASTFTSVSSGDSQFSNLSTGNINFTGNLFQNGSAYIGSQWVGTSGNIYFGTAGSSVVGINTTSPSTTLDVTGTGRITTSLTTGALYSTNQTTTNIVSTNLSTGTLNASTISTAILTASTSITTGTIRVTGNADLSTGLTTVTDLTGTNITSATIRASTLISTANLGASNITVGTIQASTLISTANLATNNFSSGTIRATTLITSANITTNNFTAGTIRSTNILTSNITTSNIIVNGTSTSTNSSSGSVVLQGGLSIDEPTNATSVSNGGALTIAGGAAIAGDLIVGGSILYSNAAAASSTFAYLTLTASDWSTDVANGSLVVYGGISVQNTANATSASSGNGLTISGGAGIGADLYVGGTGFIPSVVSTTNTTINLVATGISASNINVSGTLTVVNITSTNLAETNITTATIQATTGITSAALLVTGLASTANLTSTTSTLPNTISTNVSTATLRASTGITSAALLVTGLVSAANIFATTSTLPNTVSTNVSTATIRASTGITSAALLVTGLVSAANVFATTSTIPNIVHTNITTTSILVTNGSVIATFNSNTLGNVFTTGGNVGIGTSSPAYTLDVVGSGDFSTFVTTGTLYSTNQIVSNLSSGNLIATTLTSGNSSITGTLNTYDTVTINKSGAGAELLALVFNTERAWVLKQTGSGSDTNLVLQSQINGKNFYIQSTNGTNIAQFYDGSANSFTSVGNLHASSFTTINQNVTNLTSSIIQATGITTGTIRVTGNADLSTGLTTVTDLTGTNITTGTIRASTLISTANLGANNISSGTIRASTLISTANLSTNNLTATNLLATNQTTTNIIVTNLTSSIIQATGITTGTIRVTGNADLSTGLTTVTDLTGTNQTTTNIIVTNLTSSIIQATGITTGTIRVTGNADLSTGLTTVTDLTGTNITSGTIRASTLISTANLGANNISSGTIRASTLISTANLSTNNLTATNLLATASTITNLSIPGTLTVVNITSTNLVDTNISAATILVSGGTLNATFNSNTIGSIFTTGGNVGIGNTTPNALLHVTGNAGTDVGIFNTLQGSGSIAFRPNATAGNVIRYGGSGTGNNILRFLGVSDTEYMRIDTGNVGIGTTSPSNTLDVSGTARITTSLTTGALYSTNQTTTNIVTTNITASSIIVTGGSLNATFNSNTIGNIFTTGGSIGIGTTSPSASLHINTTNTFGHLYSGNVLQNRRIVLWNMNNNIHQFVGFGVNSNTLRYQVETTAANHIFYAASSTTNSDELMRITGVGNVVISGSTSTTSVSSGSLYSTNQTTTNIVSTAISSGNVIVNNNLNISGISSFFGGSFSANNNVTSASTVTGLLFPSATVRSFIATLNINISKPSGNLNSTVTLEGTQLDSGWILYDSALGDSTGLVFTINSSGQILYTSPNYIGWVSTTIRFEAHYYTLAGTYTPVTLPTSGNVSVTGVLSVNDTSNATSTSSGALTVSGGAGISKSLLVGENLNVGGLSNTFTGSFAAANNVAAATNVTGFLVPTATFSSFTANVNVRLLTTLTTLNAQYMFEATQSTGGWLLNDTSFGDSVGITFTITSTGQIQYTSTNVANWQSTTINFAVNAISISSGFTAVLPSSGNVSISGNLTIDSTTDSSSTSSASLVLAGGAGINKSLLLGGNFNIGGVSTQFAGTFSAANGASGASIPALSFPNANIRSFTCTISLRVVSSVNYNTQHTIDGIQRATGGWQISDSQIGDTSGITFAINSSGQLTYTSPTFTSWTSTTMHYNAVAYNISSSYTPMPMPTEGSATIAGPVVIQSTNIASSTSSGALSVSGGVGIQNNLIVANNFFVTSAGNVGIGTSSPNYTLDINGTLEASNSNGLMLFASTGNVGIGTTSPGARLHVSGACYMGGSVPTTTVSWGNITLTPLPGYETADIGFNTTIGVRHSISGLGGLLMSISTPGYIRFITGNVQNMVINTNGNVGIGIQSPNHKLEVSGAISQFSDAASNYNGYLKTNNSGQASTTLLNPGILLYSLNSTFNYGMDLGSTATGRFRTRIFAPQTADIAFSFASTAGSTSQSGFTDRVVVTGDGNVGIGTTSPIYSLDVTGTLEASNSNGLMLFASSGNLGIGTTTPSNKLDIVGSIRAMTGTSSSILINTDGAAGWGNFEMFGTNGAYIDFKNASGDDYDARIKNVGSNNSLGFYMNAAETTGMSLTSAGTLLISGDIGAFATISDRTLKTNITDISPNTALETVKTLRPVTFNWKDDIFNAARRGEFDSGFIAQEVEEVIPHAVGTYDTIDHQNTYKNMRHERIIPYLVGSIQKLESIIVELKERIGFLESK